MTRGRIKGYLMTIWYKKGYLMTRGYKKRLFDDKRV